MTSPNPTANRDWWHQHRLTTFQCACFRRAADAQDLLDRRDRCVNAWDAGNTCDGTTVSLKAGAEIPCNECDELATGACPGCHLELCDAHGPCLGVHNTRCPHIGSECMACGDRLVKGSSLCDCGDRDPTPWEVDSEENIPGDELHRMREARRLK